VALYCGKAHATISTNVVVDGKVLIGVWTKDTEGHPEGNEETTPHTYPSEDTST